MKPIQIKSSLFFKLYDCFVYGILDYHDDIRNELMEIMEKMQLRRLYTASCDLLTADEVRMLDNRYALLFIRGERPIMDFKYDILKHPDVRLTTDGKANPYIHGEPWDAGSTIELVHDPEQIAMAAESIQIPEMIESDYVLLSEEEVEKES